MHDLRPRWLSAQSFDLLSGKYITTMRGSRRQRTVIANRRPWTSVASYWVGSYGRQNRRSRRQTGACKTTSAAGGVGSKGSKSTPTAASVGSKRRAGPSAASGVATWSSDASAKFVDVVGASSEDLRLDFGFLAPLLGEELPEVLAESARVETLAAFLLLAILNAADIVEKIVLITEYRYCGRSTGGNAM